MRLKWLDAWLINKIMEDKLDEPVPIVSWIPRVEETAKVIENVKKMSKPEVFKIQNITTGEFVKFPSGKSVWTKSGHARNALRCHYGPVTVDNYDVVGFILTEVSRESADGSK